MRNIFKVKKKPVKASINTFKVSPGLLSKLVSIQVSTWNALEPCIVNTTKTEIENGEKTKAREGQRRPGTGGQGRQALTLAPAIAIALALALALALAFALALALSLSLSPSHRSSFSLKDPQGAQWPHKALKNLIRPLRVAPKGLIMPS